MASYVALAMMHSKLTRSPRIALLVLPLLLAACHKESAPPNDALAPSQAHGASASGSASTGAPSLAIERDLDVMMGGNFAADHLGPTAYDAIVARAHASATSYLDVYERRYLGETIVAPPAQPLAPLALLRKDAPSRTTDFASRLLKRWSAGDANMLRSLAEMARGEGILDVSVIAVGRSGGAASIPDAVVDIALVNASPERCIPLEVALRWKLGGHAKESLGTAALEPGARTSVRITVNGPSAMFGAPGDLGVDAYAMCGAK
jgi:hypothetical protein